MTFSFSINFSEPTIVFLVGFAITYLIVRDVIQYQRVKNYRA